MKIRSGFVSNSSSSSFIIIGSNVDSVDDYEKYDGLSIDGYQISTLYTESEYNEVIGIKLVDDEFFTEWDRIQIDKIFDISQKLSDKFNIPYDKIELIFGKTPG
ncbi:MAG: hypothetical protein WDA02_08435 [Saccharofermentanales bacterium]